MLYDTDKKAGLHPLAQYMNSEESRTGGYIPRNDDGSGLWKLEEQFRWRSHTRFQLQIPHDSSRSSRLL